MEVISSGEGRELTLTLRGELDHHAAKEAMRKLEWELDAALPSKLTLDFSGVSFMDSSGIAVVMRALKRMRAMGGSAAIKNVPPQAKKVFTAAGIFRIVPLEEGEKSDPRHLRRQGGWETRPQARFHHPARRADPRR